jgi:hypothetical protein
LTSNPAFATLYPRPIYGVIDRKQIPALFKREKLTGSVFQFCFNINGKNISHSKVEKEAEIQVARCSPMLPLWAKKRIYARF